MENYSGTLCPRVPCPVECQVWDGWCSVEGGERPSEDSRGCDWTGRLTGDWMAHWERPCWWNTVVVLGCIWDWTTPRWQSGHYPQEEKKNEGYLEYCNDTMGEEVLLMATIGSCCMICYKCSVLYITIAITIEMFVSSVAGRASFVFISSGVYRLGLLVA